MFLGKIHSYIPAGHPPHPITVSFLLLHIEINDCIITPSCYQSTDVLDLSLGVSQPAESG